MAGKRMTDYKHNAKMSMKNLGFDLFSSYFPNTRSTYTEIKEGYQEIRKTETNVGFRDIKTRLRQMPLVKFVGDMTRTAFEGLRTGKFYQSEEEIFGLNFNFDDFDLPDDSAFFDDTPSDDGTQQGQPVTDSSQEKVSDRAIFGAVGGMAKSTSVAIGKSSNMASRATVEGLYLASQSINNAIVASSTDLKAQMIATQKSIENLAVISKDTANAIQKSVALQAEMLSEIKQLKEISGDFMLPQINKKEEEEDRGVPEWYTKMKRGYMGDGLKEIGSTVARAVDNYSAQGTISMISNAIPLMMMASGGNPFVLLKTWGLEPWLDKHFKLEDLKSRFDNRIRSVPDAIQSIARTASLSDNALLRSIGDSLRIDRDMRSSVPTDKYDKGNRVFFDGMTKEAIINVIPTYLSSIVSLLSGRERTVYDYEKGMFRTLSYVKNDFYQKMPKLEYNYAGLASLMKEKMSDGDKNGLDDKRLEAFAKTIMERLAESNYTLTDFKNLSYGKAQEILKLSENELTESDFLKTRSLFEKLETDNDTYSRFRSHDAAMKGYAESRNKFMRDAAYNARKNGLISTLNDSLILDNDSIVGLANMGRGGKRRGADGKEIKPIHYDHLLKGWGEATVGSSKELGNIYGQTLSPEEIQTLNDYHKKNLGGVKIFLGDLSTSARVIAQAKIFQRLKVDREQWFQDLVNTSHYNIDAILGNKEFLDKLVNANIEEADMNARLEAMGIDEAGRERITDVMTNPDSTQDDIRETFQEELNKTSFVAEAKASINEAVNNVKTSVSDVKEGSANTKLGQAKEKLTNAYNTAADTVQKSLGDAKTKAGNFYNDNKSTINGVMKATLGVGAGYAFLKTLGNTGVGKMVGAFGLLSPVAIAAGALGAGIYAYKTDLFGRLFGDGNKVEATMKKTSNIVKTGLVGAGAIAGLSTILTPITGGAFGLMGPAALALSGLALGIAGESGKFKKALFGTDEGSFLHNMKTWMFGDEATGKKGILTEAGKSIAKFFGEGTDKMKKWFKEDIWNPLSQTFKPINNFINTTANKLFSAITGIPATLQNSLFANIRVNLTRPLMEKFDQGILQPVGGFIKRMTGGLGRFFGGLISAPFKFFRTLITGKTDKDVFYGSYGSSTATSTEYKTNMRDKQNLYNETKYMSMNEINEKYSKRDIKQIRKFRANQAQGDIEEEVQESKSLQDRLADYKERKAKENPKGVSKRYYYNQNKVKLKGRSFDMSYAGCGIACLASAISHALSERVSPAELMSEAFGWDDDAFKNGVPFTYMANLLWRLEIDARLSTGNADGVSVETIDNCLKKNGTVLIDIDDYQTDEAHCILIVGTKGDEYICFDPARGPSERYSKSILAARIKNHILVFQKRTLGQRVKENYVTYKDAVKSAMPTKDGVKARVSAIKSKALNMLPKGSLGEFLDESAQEAKAKRQEFLKEAKEGSTIKALIKSSQEIHKTLKEFRQDNNDNLNELMDKLEVQTNGVAYNIEYIKRLLTQVHGVTVDGFSEKDIAKTGMSKFTAWAKKKFRFARNLIMKPINFVMDKINGMVERVNNAINFITTFPQRVASTIHKFISAILPSKEQVLALLDIGKTFVSNLYKGTKQFLSDTWSAVKSVTKTIKDEIVGFAKATVTAIGNTAKYIGEKTMQGLHWGFGKLMEGMSWLAGKAWDGTKWVAGKVKQGLAWTWEKMTGVKDKLKEIVAPREVYVTGGHLNGVQVVEVVKAVGAVDLDYAESISRKLKSSDHKRNIENIRKGKSTIASANGFKSPKFKSGQEYADIDKRQDAQDEANTTIIQQGQETKEEKSGFLSGILGSFLGGKISGWVTPIVTSLAPKLLTLAGGIAATAIPFLTREFADSDIANQYKDFVDEKGYDGERTIDNAVKAGDRMALRTIANTAGKFGFMKTAREAFENGVKNVAQKSLSKIGVGQSVKVITEKLTQLFLNGTIRRILGDTICDKFLKAVPKIATKAGTMGAKAAAKASVRMGAYAAPPVGIVVDILAIAWDLTSGMTWDADNIMGAGQGDLTVTQRAIAGTVKMLQGFLASKGPLIFLALIPTDWLAQTLWEMVADEDEYNKWLKANEKYKAEEQKKEQQKEQAKAEFKQNVTTASLGTSTAYGATRDINLPKASPASSGRVYPAYLAGGLSDTQASMLGGYGSFDFLDMVKNLFGEKEEELFYDDNGNVIEWSDWRRNASNRKIPTIPSNDRHLKKLSDPAYRQEIIDMYNFARETYGEETAKNFMRIAYAESSWIQNAMNKNTKAEGLFQVVPSYRKAWGFKPNEAPSSFSPLEQFKRVAPNLLRNAKRNGAQPTLTNMYAALHYPVAVGKADDWVLYGKTKDPLAYKYNTGVDYDKDGNVTYSELGEFVARKGDRADGYAKALGLEGYGPMKMISQKSNAYNTLDMGIAMDFRNAGCGPAVMAMLLNKLGIRYKMSDLVEKAKAMKQGAFSGTPITYFKAVLKDVGISSAIFTDNIVRRLIMELKQGKSPIILTEASNGNPHYIIGKEFKNDKIVINDPEKSNSESISINDRRLRKAKAILIYKVPSALSNIGSKLIDGLLQGGYGLFDGISKTISDAPRKLIKDIENQAYSSISRNSKFAVVDKIAKDVVRKNASSLSGIVNTATNPIRQGMSQINSAHRSAMSMVNSVEREARNLASMPEKLAKGAIDKTINGSLREIEKAVNSTSKIVSEAANVSKMIGQQTEKMKKQGDSGSAGSSVSSAVVNKMAQDLSDIKALMAKLVSIMSNEKTNAVINGKAIYTTVGGRPVPLTASGTDDWYKTIDDITRGL